MRVDALWLGGVAIGLCACVGDAPTSTGTDAAVPDSAVEAGIDAAGTDASQDAPIEAGPPCNLGKPFGAPVPLTELNTIGQDASARLTQDELTIYFHSGTPEQLMTATRGKRTDPFGAAVAVPALNSASRQIHPSVTADNLTLYFGSDRAGTAGSIDLWIATRGTTVTNFGNVANVTSLNTGVAELDPYIMASGLSIYFARAVNGSDVFHATRTANTAFVIDSTGIFAALNGADVESSPTVTSDERTVYFRSDRSGSKGLQDIWQATRASTSDPFGSIVNVSELNTTGDDQPSWISEDGCRLYLTSSSAGTYDLYVAAKPPN